MCPLTDTRKELQNIPTSPRTYMTIPKIYTEHEGTNYTSSTVHRRVLLEVQELVGTCFAQSFCGISLTPAECLRHWDNMWNIRETVSSKIIGSVSVLRYAFICSPSERYYLSITAIFISAWHKKQKGWETNWWCSLDQIILSVSTSASLFISQHHSQQQRLNVRSISSAQGEIQPHSKKAVQHYETLCSL